MGLWFTRPGAPVELGWVKRFAAGDSPWAGKVEAVYIPRDTLRGATPTDALYPQVEQGRGTT